MAQVDTIPKTGQRARAEGFVISNQFIRSLVTSGVLPARKVGNRYLVYYPNLIAFLQCDDGQDNQPATTVPVPGIRRLEV